MKQFHLKRFIVTFSIITYFTIGCYYIGKLALLFPSMRDLLDLDTASIMKTWAVGLAFTFTPIASFIVILLILGIIWVTYTYIYEEVKNE